MKGKDLLGQREGLPVRGAGYEPAGTACLQAVFNRAECPQQLHTKNASAVVDTSASNDRSPPPVSRTTTTAAHQPTWINACGETRIIREAHLNQPISSYLTIPAPQACTTRSLPSQHRSYRPMGRNFVFLGGEGTKIFHRV